ncbi:primosomal protein N' [Rhodanobacter thiooxydans]|uniref:Replication restart protein PriA n=1 Tax=Rhodanobacter thiooxydans TaxID=416169 RepID=A0A154QGI3_9GAMM|nr:primosomal protein N' [Rhodanobacter thiooxydans]EIL97722.1 primosome assembly protein PriA [Rhodanobacter thiooxydans LCS2]KZC23266.1 primosomal protein N' [Rhodanobacter thiooxydans]MCW0203903.1 primosomal protein N' [Rhodanobacter thiooxydans]
MPAVLRVALPVPLPSLFDYLPPASGEAGVGSRVLVPFGRHRLVGVVVAIDAETAVDGGRLKQALRLLDDDALLDAELMQTLAWAADYWLGAPGEAYANALPLALREPKPLPPIGDEYWSLTSAGHSAHDAGSRRGGSKALLALLSGGALSAQQLGERQPGWREAARRLAAAGLLERSERPPSVRPLALSRAPPLNDEQRQAVASVGASLGQYQPFMLDGVTGSGKTEVYLALIEQVLAQDKQALLLVPEIGLAPQTVRRLRERLGVGVEVLHSNLSEGDRARAWLRARAGSAQVILGTRSAVFTPLPRAGLIIVDEEHDGAYKQQEGFRYHARDLALVRARALGVPVLLGSGTPSLESLANVEAGRYRSLHLRARPGAVRPPMVQIIDMRAQHLEHGLSPALLAAVAETVARGEQALVFRNRRGYAPVLLCHACGWHAGCPRCERPLTLHAGRRQLICHHCDYCQRLPSTCPTCGAGELKAQGQGTERLEEALLAQFPQVPVLRVDRETTRRRDAFEDMLATLKDDQPAILVGTQMLAKGHDLPNLTLVAIVGVDEGLHSIDFRAGERLAQLVVQVAGRAGRARKPGRVLLQTHQPEHPLLRCLLAQGYAAAARELLAERRLIRLPPYSHQVLLRAEATQREQVEAFLAAAHAALPPGAPIEVAGPMPAPMPLRAGRQRGQLLLESASRQALHAMLRPWQLALGALPAARKVRWSLDVDPIDLY